MSIVVGAASGFMGGRFLPGGEMSRPLVGQVMRDWDYVLNYAIWSALYGGMMDIGPGLWAAVAWDAEGH
jgi:hypothetical protein